MDSAKLNYSPEPGAADFLEIMGTAHSQSLELLPYPNELARVENIRALFNLQYRITSQCFWFARFTGENDEVQPIILGTFHKSLITLYAAHVLTAGGLYGPARNLVRYAFEAQLIGKFAAMSHDLKVFRRWEASQQISVARHILDRIGYPDPKVFRDFWRDLSGYSHFTRHSQQFTLLSSEDRYEAAINSGVLQVLLACNYHLVNSCFINKRSTRYYTEQFGDPERLRYLKRSMREVVKEARAQMSPFGRKHLRQYERKWLVK